MLKGACNLSARSLFIANAKGDLRQKFLSTIGERPSLPTLPFESATDCLYRIQIVVALAAAINQSINQLSNFYGGLSNRKVLHGPRNCYQHGRLNRNIQIESNDLFQATWPMKESRQKQTGAQTHTQNTEELNYNSYSCEHVIVRWWRKFFLFPISP